MIKSFRRSQIQKAPRIPLWIPVYIVMFPLIMLYYFWNLTHSQDSLHDAYHVTGGYYGSLAEAFVDGHTYLGYPPDYRLALSSNPYDPNQRLPGTPVMWDLVYYIGKDHIPHYYAYWGPVPAILFYCPYEYFHPDTNFSQLVAYFFMCGLNVLFYFAVIRVLVGYYFTHVPLYLETTLLAAYAFCNILPYNQGRPEVYEEAITCAASFTMGSFLFCLLALQSKQWRYVWIFCGSICGGLAFGCRGTYIFVWGILFLCWIYLFLVDRKKWYWLIPSSLFLITPLFCAGCATMWYNYVRFDDPFQFGIKYILNGGDCLGEDLFAIRYFPEGVWAYFFTPYQPADFFPYLDPTDAMDIPISALAVAGREQEEHCGLFTIYPVVLLAFGWFYYGRKMPDLTLRRCLLVWGGLVSLWALTISGLMSSWFLITFRYETEIQMPLLLLSSVTIVARRNSGPFWLWEKLLLTFLICYSVYCGFALGLWGPFHWIVTGEHLN